jgi:diguanylate cyclase (GGDEF)-like protein
MVARPGGDEFALLQRGTRDPGDATGLAERIIGAMSTPCHVAGHTILLGTSVGIAFAPGDGTDPDMLLKAADMALYRAKRDGGGTMPAVRAGKGRQNAGAPSAGDRPAPGAAQQ